MWTFVPHFLLTFTVIYSHYYGEITFLEVNLQLTCLIVHNVTPYGTCSHLLLLLNILGDKQV